MLKNGQCPQCASAAMVASEQGIGWESLVEVTNDEGGGRTEAWTTNLCTDCGLFESYITDSDYLAAVKPTRQGKVGSAIMRLRSELRSLAGADR